MKNSRITALLFPLALAAASCTSSVTDQKPSRPVVNRLESPTWKASIKVAGMKDPGTAIIFNGTTAVPVGFDTNFSFDIDLVPGDNQVFLFARTEHGTMSEPWSGVAIRDIRVPKNIVPAKLSATASGAGYQITGPAGTAKRGATVTINNADLGKTFTVQAGDDGSFIIDTEGAGGNHLQFFVKDLAGNESNKGLGNDGWLCSGPGTVTDNTWIPCN